MNPDHPENANNAESVATPRTFLAKFQAAIRRLSRVSPRDPKTSHSAATYHAVKKPLNHKSALFFRIALRRLQP
jgi:hypothetical protein